MKTTLGALAVAVSLLTGVGAASAMPTADIDTSFETVFEPKN